MERKQKRRRVSGTLLVATMVLATLIVFSGCQPALGSGTEPDDGDGDGDQTPTQSELVTRTLDEVGTSLFYAGFSSAEIDAIKNGAVGSLGDAATSTDPAVAVPAVVAGAEKSLGSGDSALADIDSDPEKQKAVDAIVAGAVGSISSASSSVMSRDVTATNNALKAISKVAVENLDDAGLSDVPGSAKVATRAVVRNLRKAGVQRSDIETTLDSITSGAMEGVGGAIGTDKTKLRSTVGSITSGATAGLGEAAIDGVDVQNDLPALIRSVTGAATRNIANSGVTVNESDVNAVVQELSKTTTAAVREALGDKLDDDAVNKAVREVTSATTKSLQELQTNSGLQIEVKVVVQYVAKGATEGVNEMAKAGTQVTSYAAVLKSAQAGAIKGAADAGQTLDTTDLADLETAVQNLQGRIDDLEAKLTEALDQVLTQGTTEGTAAVSNTAPVLSLTVTDGTTTYVSTDASGTITVDTSDIQKDVQLTIDASATTDAESEPEDLFFNYRVVRPDGTYASVTTDGTTAPGLHATSVVFTPQYSGRYTILVSVEDAYDSDDFIGDLIVPQDTQNTPPTLSYSVTDASSVSYTDGATLAPGTALTIDASASTDADGDILSYEIAVEEPDGNVITKTPTDGVASYTTTELVLSGNHYFTIVVSDGDAIDSAQMRLLVNTAPTVSLSLVDTTDSSTVGDGAAIDTGTELTVTATFSDADTNAVLDYEIGVLRPGETSHTTVSDATNTVAYTFTATAEGAYDIYAFVSDGWASADDGIQLSATAPALSDAEKQTAFDAAVADLHGGDPDGAYNQFASIVAADPDYMPAVIGLTMLDIANIVTDPQVQSFAVDTLGLLNYPSTMNDVFNPSGWMDPLTYTDEFGDEYTTYFPAVAGQTDQDGDGVIDEVERADALVNNMVSYVVVNDLVDLFVSEVNSRLDQVGNRLAAISDSATFTISWDIVHSTVADAELANWPYTDANNDQTAQAEEFVDFTIGKAEVEAIVAELHMLRAFNKLGQVLDLNIDLSTYYDGYVENPAPGEPYYVFPTDGLFSGTFLEERPEASTYLADAEAAFVESLTYLQSSGNAIAARGTGTGFAFASDGPLFDGTVGIDYYYDETTQTYSPLVWEDIVATADYMNIFINRALASISNETAMVMPTDFGAYPGPIEFYHAYDLESSWPDSPTTYVDGPPDAMAFNLASFFTPFGGVSAMIDLDATTGEPVVYTYSGTPIPTSASFQTVSSYDETNGNSSGFYFVKLKDLTVGGTIPTSNLPDAGIDSLNTASANNWDSTTSTASGTFHFHNQYFVENTDGTVSAYIQVPDEYAANVFVARDTAFTYYDKYYDSLADSLVTTPYTTTSYGSFWWANMSQAVPVAVAADTYEPDDTVGTAISYTVDTDGWQSRTFDTTSDQDWVSFSATTGTSYTIETTVTDVDTELFLYSSDGTTQLDYNDDWDGVASRIDYSATTTGILYVMVREYSGDTGSYELSITTGGGSVTVSPDSWEPDDTAADASTYTYGTDGYQSRTFSYSGDSDWVMFSATAGTAYTIETFDESSGLDTVLTLYAPDGSGGLTQVAYNDDYTGSFYSRIEYTPSVNETLYVEITELGGATGNYGFEIY